VKTRLISIFVCAGALTGCASPPGGFDSPVPSKRMDAAIAAAAAGDQSAIPDLIAMLESDDALVRMVAILSLERLTGEVRGYDHAAPEWERMAAVDRWTDWAQSNAPTQAQPDAPAGHTMEPDR
jgi:HEAT repeats